VEVRSVIIVLDPGLATCGAAVFAGDDLVHADVFTSKPGKKPKDARGAWSSTDRSRRIHDLATWLDQIALLATRGGAVGIDAVVLEGLGSAQSADAVAQMAAAAGCIATWARFHHVHGDRLFHCTPVEWRHGLGWSASPKPKAPSTKGLHGADKAAALKQHRAAVAAVKREDDERLYAMLAALPDGDRVAHLVAAQGRRPSDTVHGHDAFGIGRWFLRCRAGALAA